MVLIFLKRGRKKKGRKKYRRREKEKKGTRERRKEEVRNRSEREARKLAQEDHGFRQPVLLSFEVLCGKEDPCQLKLESRENNCPTAFNYYEFVINN